MALTFLQLMQQAANEVGIPEPGQIIGAQDEQSKQLLALAIREGKEFSQRANKNGGWQDLHKEYSFTTAGVEGITGNVTSGSPLITNMSSTTGIVAGMVATGNGIQYYDTTVLSIDSPTQVTLSANSNETDTGVSLTFGTDNYALPSDLEYFITKTFWDGSYRWQLLGPLEAQEKNVIKYGISPVGPRRRFWIKSNRMYLNPPPTNSTDKIYYDYYSNAFALSTLGVAQSTWLADTDTYALDEDCFILGMIWRFLRSKGLDYGQEAKTYEDACQRIMSRDGAGRDLPMNARSTNLNLLSDANIPDSNYGE